MERRFRIKVRGQLSDRFGAAFGAVEVAVRDDHTLLTGRIVDQAYLDGVLAYLRSLSIDLISVETGELAAEGAKPSSSTQKASG